MRRVFYVLTSTALMAAIPAAMAQQRPGNRGSTTRSKKAATNSMVNRMMAFDANKDGKLTRDEVTDERLQRLFDRADADHDGTVTRKELTAMAAREPAGGRGGFGPGGPGGPPRPGEVLPSFLRDRLEVTPEQSKQLEALQKDVDTRLAQILTADQKQQLEEMRNRGPGGFGPPPGGFGPGGPPPGGFGPGGPPPGGFGPGGPPEE